MDKKIQALINQLSDEEQKLLAEKLERDFSLKFVGEIMRDDIVHVVTEGLHAEFEYIEADSIKEESTFLELDIDASDIVEFTTFLIQRFDLEEIGFRKLMEWSTVKHIVDFIELALEDKGGCDES